MRVLDRIFIYIVDFWCFCWVWLGKSLVFIGKGGYRKVRVFRRFRNKDFFVKFSFLSCIFG